MTRSRRDHRTRLRALGQIDAKNRCPVCRHPYGQTRFWKMGEAVSYCSRECLDTADEREALEKQR